MNATIVPENNLHYPVLLNEVLSIISPQNGGTFIDCTFGQGGYSRKILQFPKTKVIAFDRDQNSKLIAEGLKKKFQNRFQFYNKKFSEIDVIKTSDQIKGIIFDLGFSYNQIKDPSKGLSFNHTGQLNMKMGCNKISADDIIKKLPAKDLEKIYWINFFNTISDTNYKDMEELQKKLNKLSKETNEIELKKIINEYNNL